MSYISDYLSGYTDKAEFDMYGDMENRKERWEEEHKYDEIPFFFDPESDFDDLESLDEEYEGEGKDDV